MLEHNLERVLALPEEARVLDVGGWAAPLRRADWVIDLMPYETRGQLAPGGFGPGPERYSEKTWARADICAHEPWPFEDDYFDFVVCTFTLEDVRDPIRVCEEMSRVSKAGYIEVPSILDELTWENPELSGGPWVGHDHHRWLCSLDGDVLVFLAKFHSLSSNWRVRVPPRWGRELSDEERMIAHFWEGELPARERPAIGEFPTAELERLIHERFQPSRAELRAREAAERGRELGAKVAVPLRRAAMSLVAKLPR